MMLSADLRAQQIEILEQPLVSFQLWLEVVALATFLETNLKLYFSVWT